MLSIQGNELILDLILPLSLYNYIVQEAERMNVSPHKYIQDLIKEKINDGLLLSIQET